MKKALFSKVSVPATTYIHLIFLSCAILCLILFPALQVQAKNALPQDAQKQKTAIVLVTFGSTVKQKNDPFDLLKTEIKKQYQYADTAIFVAYTSLHVARTLTSGGITAPTLPELLSRLAAEGYKNIKIQSMHIIPGKEFDDIREIADRFNGMPKGIEHIAVGLPMISSTADAMELAKALKAALPYERKPEDAVIFVGHGTHGPGSLAYPALQACFAQFDERIFVNTIAGIPQESGLEATMLHMKKLGIKNVYLSPLMLVAGSHAVNDIFGAEKESWKSQLYANGFKVVNIEKGLGEYDFSAKIFLRHLQEASE